MRAIPVARSLLASTLLGALLVACSSNGAGDMALERDPYEIAAVIRPEGLKAGIIRGLFARGGSYQLRGTAPEDPPWGMFEHDSWPGSRDIDPWNWCWRLGAKLSEQENLTYLEPIISSDQAFTAEDVPELVDLVPEHAQAFAHCGAVDLGMGPYEPGGGFRGIKVLVGTADFRLYAVDVANDDKGLRYFTYAERGYSVELAMKALGLPKTQFHAPWDLTYSLARDSDWRRRLPDAEVPKAALVGRAVFGEFDPFSCAFVSDSFQELPSYDFEWDYPRADLWPMVKGTVFEPYWPRSAINALVVSEEVVGLSTVHFSVPASESDKPMLFWDFYDLDGDSLCSDAWILHR